MPVSLSLVIVSVETRYVEQPHRHRHASQMDSSALGIAVQAYYDWLWEAGIDSYTGVLAELTLVGIRVLRPETVVAERPTAGRSPVMGSDSQSNASFPLRTLGHAQDCSAATHR